MCIGVPSSYDEEQPGLVEEENLELTNEELDMFNRVWTHFDPTGSRYIRYDQISDFVHSFQPPLQICKPNKYRIVMMDINMIEGDLMFRGDILQALKNDLFARSGRLDLIDDNEQILGRPEGYEAISSTLWRMREEHCAKVIQQCWRRYKNA